MSDQLSTGEYFAAILLALTPTTFGEALSIAANNPNPTLDDWRDELRELPDPEVIPALLSILDAPKYRQILTALLNSETLQNPDGSVLRDNQGNPVTINFASRIKDMVWNNKANLSPRWGGGPPHPRGASMLKLLDLVASYKEDSGQ